MLFALVLSLSLAGDAAALDTSGVTMERALSTKAREGIPNLKGLKAQFLVNAPPAKVAATLWDVKRFREIFPDIKSLTVRAESKDKASGIERVVANFTVDAVVKTLQYTLERFYDEKRGVIWWRELGGDLDHVRGRWIIAKGPTPNSAQVTYLSFVDVGAFVPGGLYRDLAMKKVRESAGRVRAACVPAKKPAP